jgi:hypothetical protein
MLRSVRIQARCWGNSPKTLSLPVNSVCRPVPMAMVKGLNSLSSPQTQSPHSTNKYCLLRLS